MKEYESICIRPDEALQNMRITAFTRKTIIEMSEKVLEALAEKYGKLKEGVKSVMGGRALEYEAKRILNEGRAEGRGVQPNQREAVKYYEQAVDGGYAPAQ